MNNPIKELTKKEWIIWLGSICIVCISNLLTTDFDLLTLVAALVGVTSLIFAAKGNIWAQILMVIFSILYGIISYRFHYWGEMITYLAYGDLVYDHMAPESFRRKRKCRKDPEAEPEAHHRAYYIRRDRNGSILLYFSCIRYPEYYIQHHIDHNQFSGSGTYDAPFLVLCSMVCGK